MVTLHCRDVGGLRDQLHGLRTGRALLRIRARMAFRRRGDRVGSGVGGQLPGCPPVGVFRGAQTRFGRNWEGAQKQAVSSRRRRDFSGGFKAGCGTISRLISRRGRRSEPALFRPPISGKKSMAEPASEVIRVNIEDEMRQSYLDYAMSVIVGRALPDVRD